jgi:tetratricopeptide (TPR) repeat protein
MTSCIADRARLRQLVLALALGFPALAHADYQAELGRLKAAPAKDATLHTLQAGVSAMAENQVVDAAGLFDTALSSIEGMFANTENAAKARSLWYEEGAKDFKGEPYERAMAYYYRGLLYLGQGDYENARASFRGGLLQDAFAEEQQNRSDLASFMVLEGWANQLNGDAGQAADAYSEAQRIRKDFTPPQRGANLLVIAELGGSPRKLGEGIGNHEIVYRHAKRTPEARIVVEFDGVEHALAPVEDVYMQATTRGGRPIDRIIDGKVAFQNTTEAIGSAFGTIAAEGSLLQAANGGGSHGNALGALAAVGAISSIISANVKPRADVRYWNNLPDTLHLTTLQHRGLPANVKVKLFDAQGNPVDSEQLRVQSWIDPRGNGVVWIKSRI